MRIRPLTDSLSPAPKPVVQGREGLVGFLYEKTGVTGAWTLGVGLAATLVSKELYLVNSEVGGWGLFLCVQTFTCKGGAELDQKKVGSY